MPITFIDIERRSSWRIGLLFLLLVLAYFLVSFVLVQTFVFLFPFPFMMDGSIWLFDHPGALVKVILFAFLLGTGHFLLSSFLAVRMVLENLNSSRPDPDDGIHRRFMNIMDELHIATGNRRKIRGFVIPSLSMNALAVTDLRGDAVIAITEGLLSRLSRAQIEAVVAHEAYHVLSGDCLEASVATSLFGIYAALLEKMQDAAEGEVRFYPLIIPLWMALKLGQLLSLIISREREYRADAAALRMTRNPLAMAEVLHILAKNWSGTGLISSGIEMLCLTPPDGGRESSGAGWWEDLLATHPPVEKRIAVLLKLARISPAEFRKRMLPVESAPSHPEPPREKSGQDFPGLPEEEFGHAIQSSMLNCSSCGDGLWEIRYEKTRAFRCGSCKGMLVENDRIPRIVARREYECSERIKALARAVAADNQRGLLAGRRRGRSKSGLPCPRCGHPMLRTFYSMAYLIEIDRCVPCGITWFERDELEMLQCLIDHRITPRIDLGGAV